jgi:hypothetical protein
MLPHCAHVRVFLGRRKEVFRAQIGAFFGTSPTLMAGCRFVELGNIPKVRLLAVAHFHLPFLEKSQEAV